MNILLCGLPFCGKSTYGQQAAAKLKVPFIDTDKLIEKNYFLKANQKLSCRQIHKEIGEKKFRSLEEDAIAQLALSCTATHCSIVALGGGTLLSEKNTKILNPLGTIVFLKTPIDTLIKRMM